MTKISPRKIIMVNPRELSGDGSTTSRNSNKKKDIAAKKAAAATTRANLQTNSKRSKKGIDYVGREVKKARKEEAAAV